MTKSQAIKNARERANRDGCDSCQYVVRDPCSHYYPPNNYDVADAYDLSTFYAGLSDDHIVFCTIDN